jgi:8-oxo-dGTP pyrophosphatase MutT (NUDIX family)
MQQQVSGFAFYKNKVVLIRKNRPEHLAGQLIGPGGKLKDNLESLLEAMAREFQEEAGPITDPYQWIKFCELSTHRAVIHFYYTRLTAAQYGQLKGFCEEGEIVTRHLASGWQTDCRADVAWLIPMAKGFLDKNITGEADCYRVQEIYSPGSKAAPAVNALANLEKAANTFRERAKLYGSNYNQFGGVMQRLFPDGVTFDSPEQWNRFGILAHIVTKLTRYTQRPHQGHQDSIHDIGVYSFILEELDLKGGQHD